MNEVQYRYIRSLLADFETRLHALESSAAVAARPKLGAVEIAAVRSQAETLREELRGYDRR